MEAASKWVETNRRPTPHLEASHECLVRPIVSLDGGRSPLTLCEKMTMMKTMSMLGSLLVLLAGCATVSEPNSAALAPQPDLVFVGTVESIEASPLPRSLANWIVTFRVDRIEAGDFSGETFSFRIHSPSRSGLESGKQYVVEANRTDTGYKVDQCQWMERALDKVMQTTR